jgi:hypothetical protein
MGPKTLGRQSSISGVRANGYTMARACAKSKQSGKSKIRNRTGIPFPHPNFNNQIEECEVIVRSTDVPVYVKPGVSNRVRSLPFRIQLSPAQLIASYNAQKGLFLVDYLLTATARRKCPRTGWNLLKLETRTFVSITPPQVEIEKPLHVTPYSPPLDDMDLFRCPFMQTIRVWSMFKIS